MYCIKGEVCVCWRFPALLALVRLRASGGAVGKLPAKTDLSSTVCCLPILKVGGEGHTFSRFFHSFSSCLDYKFF